MTYGKLMTMLKNNERAERVREMLQGTLPTDMVLKSLHAGVENGRAVYDLQGESWAALLVAWSFEDILDKSPEAENFMQLTFGRSKNLDRVLVTLVRKGGMTPTEKLDLYEKKVREAEQAVEDTHKRLDVVEKKLADEGFCL